MDDSMIIGEVWKGVDLLDDRIPDWPSRIDVSYLDMGHPRRCVVGQLFSAADIYAPYSHGVAALRVDALIGPWGYGFNCCPWPDCRLIEGMEESGHMARLHMSYADLTEQWAHIVRSRRDEY
jgi:hypothetical protein